MEIGNLSLNTASSTTYTIRYRAVDQAGNVGTAEREVVVGEGASDANLATPPAADANVANEELAPVAEETATNMPPVVEETTATSTPLVTEEPTATSTPLSTDPESAPAASTQ